MKFNHGYWMMKPGLSANCAVEVAEYRKTDTGVEFLAATKNVRHREDSLNSPLLTVSCFTPMQNVIGVRIVHHKGSQKRGPGFRISRKNTDGKILDSGDHISFCSGKLSLTVPKKGNWNAVFRGGDSVLTDSGWKNAAFIQQEAGFQGLIGHETGTNGGCYMVEQLKLSPGEKIYGLGERFTPVVKNGQAIDLWNEDPGTASEQAYKNVPFYLSSRGYGVFINSPGKVSIEAGSEKVSRVSFTVPGQELEYYIIYGEDMKDVLSNYTALTGRPPLPPAWSFGLWLSTSFLTDYDEATVTEFLDGMKKEDIPLSVFHFDCFWMKQYRWVDFHWDPDLFPDPKGMLSRIKAGGIRICVWINPYIAQQSALFDEAASKGYLLKKEDGSVWQTDQWQAGMGIVDFTNPDAAAWYQACLERLLDTGVDCFKTDFGERIPVNVRYHDNSDPALMHIYYSFVYNKTVYDILARRRGIEEAIVFARSATAGCQQFPIHWGGDCLASYDSMAESLRGGLSLCLSGFSFWSHDIGGFEHTATPDIYKRWAAFGLLSTHSRLHGSESYRVPWNFDKEAVGVLRFFTKLKLKLMPYIYRWAAESAHTGIPLMRHMILEFGNDRAVHHLDMQYLLGPDLIVAPVFSESGEAEWYVPEGEWTNIITGATYEGPRWFKEQFDYYSLPLLARPGSIIPMGAGPHSPEYAYNENPRVHIFGPEGSDRFVFIGIDGNECGEAEYTIDSAKLTVKWKNLSKPEFIIYTGTGYAPFTGADAAISIAYSRNRITCSVSETGDGSFVLKKTD